MLCALFLLVCLIVSGVLVVRPDLRRKVFGSGGEPAGPVVPGDTVRPARRPQTLEDVLTRQLVAGEITGRQYRRAMASIAIRDAERHPLQVPPDLNPPEAA